jgi:hypothetical protein
LKNELPVLMMDKLAKVPGLTTTNFKKNIEKGKMINARAWETGLLFDHFTTNSWIFESLQIEELQRMMSW